MVGQIQSATDVYSQIKSLMSQAAAAVQAATPADVQTTADSAGPVGNPISPPTLSQVVDTTTLVQLERARVTYQAQGSEPGRRYAYSATLTYERVAYAQTTQTQAGTTGSDATAPTPATDAAAPTSTDDATTASPNSTPPEPAPITAPAPDTSAVLLHHIVINATTVWYRRLTAHVVAAPSASTADTPAAPAQATSTATSQTTSSPATDTSASVSPSEPAIKKLGVDDFASLRSRTVDRSRESSLVLKLTTQEGDLVELTFRQLDVLTQTRLKGVTDSGDRVRATDTTGNSQRNVNMQITGDLSDAEKSAIDSVLQNVIDVANQFFHGDLQAAMGKMADAQIDTSQLAEVSLKMSMSQNREMNKVTVGDDGKIQQMAHRDSGASQALEFLADQQQTLITAAKTQFDDHSAVKLVKQLLPALIAPCRPAVPPPIQWRSRRTTLPCPQPILR